MKVTFELPNIRTTYGFGGKGVAWVRGRDG